MIYREQLEELMAVLDDIREDLTHRLEQDCTIEEADLLSGIITNLSESIDDIGFFIAEADR